MPKPHKKLNTQKKQRILYYILINTNRLLEAKHIIHKSFLRNNNKMKKKKLLSCGFPTAERRKISVVVTQEFSSSCCFCFKKIKK